MTDVSEGEYLDNGELSHVLRCGRSVEDPVAVRRPLYVAKPPRSVRVAHQIRVKGDGVIAGVA